LLRNWFYQYVAQTPRLLIENWLIGPRSKLPRRLIRRYLPLCRMPTTRRIAVILAAGRGRRMGRTKQLVEIQTPDGPKALVAAAYDAVRSICDEMLVVVGHEADLVTAALECRAFHRAASDPDAPMFESIRAGLRTARSIDPAATVVLQPGDHPIVAATTLAALVDSSLKRPDQAIIPEYQGRGGHPVLIPAPVVEIVVAARCPSGLGDFWLAHPELCARVPIGDPTVIRDVDTSADLPG
jgi:molybdenum cofactor cytidylyltransferase